MKKQNPSTTLARSAGSAQEKVFEIVAEIAASFGSSARLKILFRLANAPRGVEELAELTGESVANASQHLRRLFAEGLVEVRKQGLARIYSLRSPEVARVLESLFELAAELAPEIAREDAKITEPALWAAVEGEELFRQISSKAATLIDLRDSPEATATPIAHALHVEMEELRDQASGFSKDRTYYVVCRGRYCPVASEGVRMLRALGLKAYRIQESPSRWNELAKTEPDKQ